MNTGVKNESSLISEGLRSMVRTAPMISNNAEIAYTSFYVRVFDVGAGQCILVRQDNLFTLIDCKYSEECMLRIKNITKAIYGFPIIHNLIITNYDEDHFSGINWLINNNVTVQNIYLSDNLSSEEIISLKSEITPNLQTILKEKANCKMPPQLPPGLCAFSLKKEELPEGARNTNNLSQVIFIVQNGVTICIPGDIQEEGWEALSNREEFQMLLRKTDVLIASHHGRINGYNADALSLCKNLKCVVISDKSIQHDIQNNMSSSYGKHIYGNGIVCYKRCEGSIIERRKVLTTRNDGDILIEVDPEGRAYSIISSNSQFQRQLSCKN